MKTVAVLSECKESIKKGDSLMDIAVLIPCYNEELTVEKVVRDFRKELPEAKIYVYNNNSTDKTVELAIKAGATVRNEHKQGKGNVVQTMFEEIDADIYVLVDGDNTYPAKAINELMKPIIDGTADMVVGDRLSNGTYKKENKRLFHNFGNILVKKAINMSFGSKLNDIMTGYRVFNKKIVKNLPITTKKFEIETEMTLQALDKNYIIKEIPIEYKDRPNGSKSKLNTISDGIKVIREIIRLFKDYKPLKFFMLLAFILLMLGLIVGIPVIIEFFRTNYIAKVPSAILATGLILLSVIFGQCGIILDTFVKRNKENYRLNILRYTQMEENSKLLKKLIERKE